MSQRYRFLVSFLSFVLLVGTAAISDPAAAQCTSVTIDEDVENVTRSELFAQGWEIFGTSLTTTNALNGAQSFQTSGANGNPNDNRIIYTPYVTLSDDVCIEFEYLPNSPGPNTFLRIGVIGADDTFYTFEELDLGGVTTQQSYQRTFTATEVQNAAPGVTTARIALAFNGDNAGGRYLIVDDVAITEAPRYDQGSGDYSNAAPTVTGESFNTQIGQEVTANVLDNDSDPDILNGINDGPLEASVVSGVSNGSLTFNADGSFEYTPTSDGTDSFEYEVCDNGFDPACATGIAEFNVAIPVELGAISAQSDGPDVVIRWTTLSETNNKGFDVEHRADWGFQKVGFVKGQNTTTETASYRFRMKNLTPGEHTFRLRQVDVDGDDEYSPEVTATVTLGNALTLRPSGANPFRSQTSILYGVETAEPVVIDLFDVLGRRVRTLYQGTPTPGRLHTLTVRANGLAPGRYLVRAQSGDRQVTQPITVVQ